MNSEERQRVILIGAVKNAYRKHCLDDDRIGWAELEKTLLDALTETMGDSAFELWLDEVSQCDDFEFLGG